MEYLRGQQHGRPLALRRLVRRRTRAMGGASLRRASTSHRPSDLRPGAWPLFAQPSMGGAGLTDGARSIQTYKHTKAAMSTERGRGPIRGGRSRASTRPRSVPWRNLYGRGSRLVVEGDHDSEARDDLDVRVVQRRDRRSRGRRASARRRREPSVLASSPDRRAKYQGHSVTGGSPWTGPSWTTERSKIALS